MKTKITLLLLLAGILRAQTLAWTKPMVDYNNSGPYTTPFHIATDNSGNVFTTGWFNGTVDFDPGPGTAMLSSTGASAFVIKKDSYGNFLWVANLQGGSSNGRFNISTDNTGNVYVHGFFSGTCDFDPGSGTQTMSSNSLTPSQYGYGQDQFIWKLSASGNLVWAMHMAPNQFVNDLKADASGNLYTAGIFNGVCDFDPGINTNALTSFGTQDGFIAKFDATGNLINIAQVGGSGASGGIDHLTIDPSNNVCATGSVSGNIDVDPGVGIHMLSAPSHEDFSLRLNSAGAFLSAFSFASPAGCKVQSKLQDTYGNVYVTGTFSGTCDFDPGFSTYTMQATNGIFLYKLDQTGNFAWAKSLALTSTLSINIPCALAIDGGANIYFSGLYSGTLDADPGQGVFSINTGTLNLSLFITTLNSNGDFISALSVSSDDWVIHPGGDLYSMDRYSVSKFSSLITGINEVKKNNDLQLTIYPNPCNGEFNLRTRSSTVNYIVEIYNNQGQKIEEQKIDSESTLIDLKNSANGTYLLRVTDSDNNIWQKKIIKE